jgi:DNA-binding protein YbaB
VALDDSVVQPGEGEILADLLVAAHADAKRKLDQTQAQMMQDAAGPMAGMMGGAGIPGLKF